MIEINLKFENAQANKIVTIKMQKPLTKLNVLWGPF